MKKIILLPKTDTVIICLPEKWVGVPIICRLEPLPGQYLNFDEVEKEAERAFLFRNKQRRKRRKKLS